MVITQEKITVYNYNPTDTEHKVFICKNIKFLPCSPVSYTHLDVYKRQILDSPVGLRLCCESSGLPYNIAAFNNNLVQLKQLQCQGFGFVNPSSSNSRKTSKR